MENKPVADSDYYSEGWKEFHALPRTEITPVPKFVPDSEVRSLEDVWYFVYRAWAHHVRYWLKDIRYGIGNLIAYAPLLWRDRDWDHTYMWKLLLKKLKRMEPAIRQVSMEGPHNAALRRCIYLLEELLRRDPCDCGHLGEPSCKFLECNKTQEAMLEEFGMLFGKYSQQWWD
jgi:hypothetical protein